MERSNNKPDEIGSWKKTLAFLQQENTFQKNKLVETLKNEEKDTNFLEMAEQYQNQFLQQDEAFRLMWTDLTSLEKSMKDNIVKNNHTGKEIHYLQKKLKSEIKILDTNFEKLKNNFNGFLNNFFEQDFYR
jgi:hypothetical protein